MNYTDILFIASLFDFPPKKCTQSRNININIPREKGMIIRLANEFEIAILLLFDFPTINHIAFVCLLQKHMIQSLKTYRIQLNNIYYAYLPINLHKTNLKLSKQRHQQLPHLPLSLSLFLSEFIAILQNTIIA